MKQTSEAKAVFRNHWWLKTLVALGPGFALSIGLVGLFAWWGPGGINAPNKVQFNMWMVPLVWLVVLNLVYPMRSGWQALGWIGGLALLTQILLYFSRTQWGVQ